MKYIERNVNKVINRKGSAHWTLKIHKAKHLHSCLRHVTADDFHYLLITSITLIP